jgi:Zn-dependent peptidase ImmA (M78 family)
VSRIDKKADALLERLKIGSMPVDPMAIAEQLGVLVSEEELDSDISGLLVRDGLSTVIAVNKSQSPARRRFTVAHELGHYYLGHKGDIFIDKLVVNRRDGKSSAAIDQQEIEANAFAAALLMPKHLVLKELSTSVKHNQTGAETVKQLAKSFGVSEQAMNYRLVNLGLITTDF